MVRTERDRKCYVGSLIATEREREKKTFILLGQQQNHMQCKKPKQLQFANTKERFGCSTKKATILNNCVFTIYRGRYGWLSGECSSANEKKPRRA